MTRVHRLRLRIIGRILTVRTNRLASSPASEQTYDYGRRKRMELGIRAAVQDEFVRCAAEVDESRLLARQDVIEVMVLIPVIGTAF